MSATHMSQTTDLPLAPLFLCDERSDWIELETRVETECKLFRLRSAKKYEFIAYAANQTKWKKQYETPRFSIWSRLIQYVRTPNVMVPIRWHDCGSYRIEELRCVFLKAVEHDDDALTQFVEREELIRRLNVATTFEDLVGVWDCLSLDS
jgi:hypothetical protein